MPNSQNKFIFDNGDFDSMKQELSQINWEKEIQGLSVKGNLSSKKSLAQMKDREKCKKRAITDLNAPNGSQDIPF